VAADGASFDTDLAALAQDLQQWRAECAAEPPSPDDFPPLDARALGQGSFFFAMDFILGALAFPNGRPLMDDSWPWFVIVTSTLVLAFGLGFFLGVIKAHGLHERRFWRALRQSTGSADPFALTLMREMLDRDLKAARRLEVYALPVLIAAKERFSLTEETLRARVNLFFGNPSLLVLAGLLGATWSSWKDYWAHDGTVTFLLVAGSFGLFLLSLYGAKLNFSLPDLTRCRTLLTLEIARRSAATIPSHHGR
jgi:hypothetical protein